MPRKHPLSKTDLDIAKRLTLLRKSWRLSRQDLAKRSGLSEGAIARIELGRMPLLYDHACVLLKAIKNGSPLDPDPSPFNPLWLAYGTDPEYLNWPIYLPPSANLNLPANITFSDFLVEYRPVLELLTNRFPPEAELPESWLLPYLVQFTMMRNRLARADMGLAILGCLIEFSAERLAKQGSKTAAKLLKKYGAIYFPGNPASACGDETSLTDVNKSETMQAMTMKTLLARLREATAERGEKSKLARSLGVSVANVSQWLSGDREPSGETTLKLLHWVNQHERQ